MVGIRGEAQRISDEIQQIFLDAEHWNRIHPEEPPIDPDPDGRLRSIKEALDRGLALLERWVEEAPEEPGGSSDA